MAAEQIAREHFEASSKVEPRGAAMKSSFAGRSILATLAAVLAATAIAACVPVVGPDQDDMSDMDDTDDTDSAAPVDSSSSGKVLPAIKFDLGDQGCGDVQSDPQNCGGCGRTCLVTQACNKGSCADQPTDCSVTGTCASKTCTEQGRYSVNAQIAVDLLHNRRLWQRDYAESLDYGQAVAYCANLEIDGITGWRLPDGAESRSIVLRAGGLKGCPITEEYCAPAIDQAVFPETAVDLYWTTEVYDDGIHLCRSFCDGRSTPYQEMDDVTHYVRCVHDPLSDAPQPL